MKYVGRPPDSDYSIVHKKYADERYAAIDVDQAFITDEIAGQAVPLVTPSYVDTQDALRARKTNVDAADANYLSTSVVGAASGVAPLDTSTFVPAANLPTLVTNRLPTFVPATAISISGDRVVTTTNAKEYQAATLTINDPGYPYVPLIFAQIQGGSTQGTAANRLMGTGAFGQASVLKSDDDAKYSWCLCTASKTRDYHTAIPFADSTINPTTRPPIEGAATFGLWIGCFSGATYTFNSTGLNFYALVFPGF